MGDTNSIVVVLLCVFIFISASFTLVKAVFAAIYAKRDSRDRTDREEKIAKIVETGGYNETVSIGRIFSDVGIGVAVDPRLLAARASGIHGMCECRDLCCYNLLPEYYRNSKTGYFICNPCSALQAYSHAVCACG